MMILISDRYEKVTQVASSHQDKENSGGNLKDESLELVFARSPQHLAAQTSHAL